MKNPSNNEVIFMETLVDQLKQFAECSEIDALEFVCVLLDKLDKLNIKVK